MLATRIVRTAPGLDMFRPSVIRIHELPVVAETPQTLYAPALSFPQHITVQQAIEALREMQLENDSIYYLFVTDYNEHLVGVMSLRQLIVASPTSRLFEVMDRRLITLPPDATLEQQAELMSSTGLLALPIVDDEGRLVGAMDVNDLIAEVKKEATEGMYTLAGVCKKDAMDLSLINAAGDRMLSLIVNMVGMFIAAWVVRMFSHTTGQFAILAVFIPVILGQTKTTGTQTLTFVVRSLMLGKVLLHDARRVVSRELAIGMFNGLCIGFVVGCISWFWQSSLVLGVIAGGATFVSMLVASGIGVFVPLVFKAFRIDPARATDQIVTAMTYVCALFFLLGMGTLALHMGYF
jgi:magnesium transporter